MAALLHLFCENIKKIYIYCMYVISNLLEAHFLFNIAFFPTIFLHKLTLMVSYSNSEWVGGLWLSRVC